MSLNIKPICGSNNRVIVEPFPAETITAGGIIIPDTAKEKPSKGTVVAISEDDKEKMPTLKEGQIVVYGKYSGTELKWEGKEYLILKESEIFGYLTN